MMGENILKHLSPDYNFSDHMVKSVQSSEENSSFTNISPKAQTSDIKNINHMMY